MASHRVLTLLGLCMMAALSLSVAQEVTDANGLAADYLQLGEGVRTAALQEPEEEAAQEGGDPDGGAPADEEAVVETAADEEPVDMETHQESLFECQEKITEAGKKALQLQTLNENCAQKLSSAELEIAQTEKTIVDEKSVRVKAEEDIKTSEEEKAKSEALAEHEKALRFEAAEACAERVNVLREANEAAIADQESKTQEHSAQMSAAQVKIGTRAEQEKTELTNQLTNVKDEQIQKANDEKASTIEHAQVQCTLRIKAKKFEISEAGCQGEAEDTTVLNQLESAAQEQIVTVQEKRDRAVKRSEDQRDNAAAQLEALKTSLEEAQTAAIFATKARAAAEKELTEYKTWAQNQLAEKKSKADAAADALGAASNAQAGTGKKL